MNEKLSPIFKIKSDLSPKGQQLQAINKLAVGINAGMDKQTLLGVTGSGKTFTIAHVIAKLQRPALVIAPNKTLAAQLYGELYTLFPDNAVGYFVSYYDYYQPEVYVVSTDNYISKDAAINEHIEQMRLSATKYLMQRRDVIIVTTVSAIYGLGDPSSYLDMLLHLKCGEHIDRRRVLHRLVALQYKRNQTELCRATYRVTGDVIDIYPAESSKHAIRIELFGDEIECIRYFDPLTGALIEELEQVTIYPKTHYATSRERLLQSIELIKIELKQRLTVLRESGRLVEAQRLEERTYFDIEMINEMGYCNGIENYSRYLSGRQAGEPPPTLLDYFHNDALWIIDESHVTIPQLGAMYRGDRSRKENLVEYGFRLPSALDNRPLRFDEIEAVPLQKIYVSATPGPYELKQAEQIVELIVRPTGLLDPQVEIRPIADQVDDLLSEIAQRTKKRQRVLVTTLTKRMSEDLTEYLASHGVRVRYLHADVDTVERIEILRQLRLGEYDVIVGINLLREGLDLPEVSLVAILDADKQGFLRSKSSLVQTIGRAARHIDGKAILYADKITDAIAYAVSETERRRKIQNEFNREYGITPRGIVKVVHDVMALARPTTLKVKEPSLESGGADARLSPTEFSERIASLTKQMNRAAKELDFEQASQLRDHIETLKRHFFELDAPQQF